MRELSHTELSNLSKNSKLLSGKDGILCSQSWGSRMGADKCLLHQRMKHTFNRKENYFNFDIVFIFSLHSSLKSGHQTFFLSVGSISVGVFLEKLWGLGESNF